MTEQISEKIEVLDASGNVTVTLDATRGDATLGGNGRGGDVRLFASADSSPSADLAKIALSGQNARVQVGGNGQRGSVAIYTAAETAVDDDQQAAVFLGAGNALIRAGGNGDDGEVRIYAGDGTATGDRDATTILLDGSDAYLRLGGNGHNGDAALFASDANSVVKDDATIYLDGSEGYVRVGGNGWNGDMALFPSTDAPTDKDRAVIYLDGASGNVRLGGHGLDGDLRLFPSRATDVDDEDNASILLNADDGFLRLGGGGIEGDLVVYDANGAERIRLDGSTGDVRLRSADIAEQFDVPSGALSPGTVVAFQDEETVIQATEAYDQRVAGVIAGAGNYSPAMVLGWAAHTARQSVSVLGKAFCLVDSAHGPIRAGDLLVTSSTPGHAMRASDPSRALGTALGKALRDFDGGRGLIPVLVTLR